MFQKLKYAAFFFSEKILTIHEETEAAADTKEIENKGVNKDTVSSEMGSLGDTESGLVTDNIKEEVIDPEYGDSDSCAISHRTKISSHAKDAKDKGIKDHEKTDSSGESTLSSDIEVKSEDIDTNSVTIKEEVEDIPARVSDPVPVSVVPNAHCLLRTTKTVPVFATSTFGTQPQRAVLIRTQTGNTVQAIGVPNPAIQNQTIGVQNPAILNPTVNLAIPGVQNPLVSVQNPRIQNPLVLQGASIRMVNSPDTGPTMFLQGPHLRLASNQPSGVLVPQVNVVPSAVRSVQNPKLLTRQSQPNLKGEGSQTNIKTGGSQPNLKSWGSQPNVKAGISQQSLKAGVSQQNLKAGLSQQSLNSGGSQLLAEAVGSKQVVETEGSQPTLTPNAPQKRKREEEEEKPTSTVRTLLSFIPWMALFLWNRFWWIELK